MTRDPIEAADDSRKSYDLAIKALRERHIRNHAINPRPDNADEMRWWAEGWTGHLETVERPFG